MGTYSALHWIVLLLPIAVLVLTVIPLVRILQRLGFSPVWCILFFVPVGNVVGLWLLANSPWPMTPGGAENQPRS